MDEKTETMLRKLAERLGTTTEYLWSAAVERQHAEGIALTVVSIAWLFASLSIPGLLLFLGKRSGWTYWIRAPFERVVMLSFALIAVLASSISTVVFALDDLKVGITKFLAPEGSALDYILEML